MSGLALLVAIVALVIGGWGVIEGRKANREGRELTEWARVSLYGTYLPHAHRHDHPPGDPGDHELPPPPPPW